MEFFNELLYRKQLGGMTNINLLVAYEGKDYVLRIPSMEFEGIIDREVERYNNQIATENNISIPTIVFTDEGIKVSPYLAETEALTEELLKTEEYLGKIGKLFSALHKIENKFIKDFNYWEEVVSYQNALDEIPSIYKDIEKRVEKLTNEERMEYVPCHIDPLLGNFIQNDSKQIFLVDWEYSANYLPEWDLAAFILEGELSQEEEESFLRAYQMNTKIKLTQESINLQKVKQDFLWSFWGLIKEKEDPTFKEYVAKRTNRLLDNLQELEK